MKKYIVVGMFSFLLGAIVALGISNITQPPATPTAKEDTAASVAKESSSSKPSVSSESPAPSTSSSEKSISELYRLIPPQTTYKNLVLAKAAEAEAYIAAHGYTLTSKANKNLNEKSLISESSTELPNPIDAYGKETYLYFWATDAQAKELGAVRSDGKVVFFKATDAYLNSLK
ncbi:hypothetical protein AALM99_02580 [Lactococcus muris]|uniref:Lipoprotein n=1 Tax=Lactococcus muris TaxID=2941330 RepID=A0ABV4D7S5_9LACT|nr:MULTISPECIES: hypothetical protein [Lactococcus]MBL3716346.1 hypothetical protein [Lactococcus garvieae]